MEGQKGIERKERKGQGRKRGGKEEAGKGERGVVAPLNENSGYGPVRSKCFTSRRYAQCHKMSVRPSVCLSHAGVLLKQF